VKGIHAQTVAENMILVVTIKALRTIMAALPEEPTHLLVNVHKAVHLDTVELAHTLNHTRDMAILRVEVIKIVDLKTIAIILIQEETLQEAINSPFIKAMILILRIQEQ
jgi:hypothetical protein